MRYCGVVLEPQDGNSAPERSRKELLAFSFM